MHRGQLLGDLGRARDRAPPHRAVRRARRGPRPGLGRAPDLDQPALADLHGRQLGRGPCRAAGPVPGHRGQGQGGRRPARPDHQPAPLPAGRPPLRVLLRGPAAHRPHRRRLRPRRAGRGRRRHPQALRGQRRRDRAVHRRHPGGGAGPARALPGPLRAPGPRGRRLAGDGRLQRRQRRHHDREPAPGRPPERRVGLRRRGRLRLARHPFARRRRPRRHRPRHARPHRPLGRRPGRRRPRRLDPPVRRRRQGPQAAAPGREGRGLEGGSTGCPRDGPRGGSERTGWGGAGAGGGGRRGGAGAQRGGCAAAGPGRLAAGGGGRAWGGPAAESGGWQRDRVPRGGGVAGGGAAGGAGARGRGGAWVGCPDPSGGWSRWAPGR